MGASLLGLRVAVVVLVCTCGMLLLNTATQMRVVWPPPDSSVKTSTSELDRSLSLLGLKDAQTRLLNPSQEVTQPLLHVPAAVQTTSSFVDSLSPTRHQAALSYEISTFTAPGTRHPESVISPNRVASSRQQLALGNTAGSAASSASISSLAQGVDSSHHRSEPFAGSPSSAQSLRSQRSAQALSAVGAQKNVTLTVGHETEARRSISRSSSKASVSNTLTSKSSVVAIPLHRVAARWLQRCSSASTVGVTLGKSEYWRERKHLLFYRHLHCMVGRYAAGAHSVLDVGSGLPPFVGCLVWIPDRSIVGPRFAGNVAKGGGETLGLKSIETKFNVSAFKADFLQWAPPLTAVGSAQRAYDLVICSEVVEHVAQPRLFIKKLLQTAHVVVLAVPYQWAPCKGCHHKQDDISLSKIVEWAGQQPYTYNVVTEADGDSRIICIFRTVEGKAFEGDALEGFTNYSVDTSALDETVVQEHTQKSRQNPSQRKTHRVTDRPGKSRRGSSHAEAERKTRNTKHAKKGH